MSAQTLDIKRSVRIIRRHMRTVVVVAVLGLAAGAAYTVRNPPLRSSTALVILPPSVHDISTQALIASSDQVLASALRSVHSTMSPQALQAELKVANLTANVLSINAEGKTSAAAENMANAVARSFIAYVGRSNSASGNVSARLFQPANTASGGPLVTHLLITAGLGGLLGAVLGAIGALAVGRGDRRLRLRDEFADALGVPVIASLPILHPGSAAKWASLLEDYELGAAEAWRLRNAFHYFGVSDAADFAHGPHEDGYSLTVLSLSSDRHALAVGPQLAVFAASHGILTALVIGHQQDTNATATLRAACAALSSSSARAGRLWAVLADREEVATLPSGALTIVVSVVDERTPQVADAIPTTSTILAVTPGAATAEQLARAAASAAAERLEIQGIVVADPDNDDPTTGRVPNLARPPRRTQPTRVTDISTGTRW